MRERNNWLEIDDYIYSCKNLDGDEKIILSAIISYENTGKALYMSRNTFADTYGMSIATVKRKFAYLIQINLIKDTGKGLKINWDELDFFLNIKKKLKTRNAGPGRKKNQLDTTDAVEHGINLIPPKNQLDSTQRINLIPHGINLIPPKNQLDTELLKNNNSILQKEITKDIKGNSTFDDSFFDDVDLEQRLDFKHKESIFEKEKLPENWLDQLNLK